MFVISYTITHNNDNYLTIKISFVLAKEEGYWNFLFESLGSTFNTLTSGGHYTNDEVETGDQIRSGEVRLVSSPVPAYFPYPLPFDHPTPH